MLLPVKSSLLVLVHGFEHVFLYLVLVLPSESLFKVIDHAGRNLILTFFILLDLVYLLHYRRFYSELCSSFLIPVFLSHEACLIWLHVEPLSLDSSRHAMCILLDFFDVCNVLVTVCYHVVLFGDELLPNVQHRFCALRLWILRWLWLAVPRSVHDWTTHWWLFAVLLVITRLHWIMMPFTVLHNCHVFWLVVPTTRTAPLRIHLEVFGRFILRLLAIPVFFSHKHCRFFPREIHYRGCLSRRRLRSTNMLSRGDSLLFLHCLLIDFLLSSLRFPLRRHCFDWVL